MPTYEYECRGCGHRFEEFHKISDAPVRTCPKCRKDKVQRLISAGGGFIFKGSGFYVTDSKKSSASPSESKKTTRKEKKTARKTPDSGGTAS